MANVTVHLHEICIQIQSETDTPFGNYSVDTRGVSCETAKASSAGNSHIIFPLLIMMSTLVGNLTLIVVLTSHRKRRIRRVNIFLVNLAISDLAVACILMTTEILFLAFDNEWVLGPVICKLSTYLQVVTLAAATFLLTAMSVDRYQVIVKPMQALRHRPRILRKVLVAWLLAFIVASPQLAIFLQVNDGFNSDGTPKKACKSSGYTAEWQRKLYFTYFTLYVLIIPTIIMTFCYSRIMEVIWNRATDECYSSHSDSQHGNAKSTTGTSSTGMSVNKHLVSSSKRKVILMTLTVIIGFLSCCTPYFIVELIRIYSNYALKLDNSLTVSKMIFMTHSALNPILYGLFTARCRDISTCMRKLCRSECLRYGRSMREQNSPTAARTQPQTISNQWRTPRNRRTPFDFLFAKERLHRGHTPSYHASSMGLLVTSENSRVSTNPRYQYTAVAVSPLSGPRTSANTSSVCVRQSGENYKSGHHSEASQTSYSESSSVNGPVTGRQLLSSSQKHSQAPNTELREYLSTV